MTVEDVREGVACAGRTLGEGALHGPGTVRESTVILATDEEALMGLNQSSARLGQLKRPLAPSQSYRNCIAFIRIFILLWVPPMLRQNYKLNFQVLDFTVAFTTMYSFFPSAAGSQCSARLWCSRPTQLGFSFRPLHPPTHHPPPSTFRRSEVFPRPYV